MRLIILLLVFSIGTHAISPAPKICSPRKERSIPNRFKTELSQILALSLTPSQCHIPPDTLSDLILSRTNSIECIYRTIKSYNSKFECFGQIYKKLRKMAVVKQDKRLLRISHLAYFIGRSLKTHGMVHRL